MSKPIWFDTRGLIHLGSITFPNTKEGIKNLLTYVGTQPDIDMKQVLWELIKHARL